MTGRAGGLVLAVLALQLAFVGSYLGAFRTSTPSRVPFAVSAPAPARHELIDRLNALPGEPLAARAAPDEDTARWQVDHRQVYGALVIDPTGDRLIIATAAGAPIGRALVALLTPLEEQQQRRFTIEDARPARPGDADGLTGFYLALSWVIGGYLAAVAISASKGARPANPRRALIRLGFLLLYALSSGLGGAVINGQLLGTPAGQLSRLWWFGALLVYAAGCFTMALQAALGFLGAGLTVLIFVVLGEPSAGGAYPAPLLPPFWRTIGPWLPPGLGTDAIRGIVYFDGAGVRRSALMLTAYVGVGIVGTLLIAVLARPRKVTVHLPLPAPKPEAAYHS